MIAVIGVLLSLLLPAIVHLREKARNTSCSNKMKQIGLAMHQHVAVHNEYPDIFGNSTWTVDLLPHLEAAEANELAQRLLTTGDYVTHGEISRISLAVFVCSSETGSQKDEVGQALGSYALNTQMGVIPKSHLCSDGLSNTALCVESHELRNAWIHGPLIETFEVDGPHPSSLKMLFGDGSVRQFSALTDAAVLQAVGTPAGGEVCVLE